MSLFTFIMDHFDDLPHFLESPPTEAKFVSMVRTLLGQPQAKMNHAQFGRLFKGAKKVFLMPFFDFTSGEIKLRYTDFEDAYQCARHHWEFRLDLTCKKGHPLDCLLYTSPSPRD